MRTRYHHGNVLTLEHEADRHDVTVGVVDLLDAANFDDVIRGIQSRAAHTPESDWIVCTPIGEPHYFIRCDYTTLEERRMPGRYDLDR